jgi:hypothetical protein
MLRTALVALALSLGAGALFAADEPLVHVPAQPPRTPAPLFVPSEYPMPGMPAPGTYQMRCWQRGKLLFTETNLADPVVANMPGKVAAFTEKGVRVDPGSANLYVIEVADSLCVVKRG